MTSLGENRAIHNDPIADMSVGFGSDDVVADCEGYDGSNFNEDGSHWVQDMVEVMTSVSEAASTDLAKGQHQNEHTRDQKRVHHTDACEGSCGLDNPSEILADKMDELTLEERCQVYEDLHGVHSVPEATANIIEAKLVDLEMELHLIRKKRAYDVARRANAAYVTSRKFRIPFLRCEDFDSFKAARRLVAWCELRMKLFGPAVMGRDLLLSDLCPISREVVELGIQQILPELDSAGRIVVCGMNAQPRHLGNLAQAKVACYLVNCAMYDENVQKNGVVAIRGYSKLHTCKLPFLGNLNRLVPGNLSLVQCMPARLRALHYVDNESPIAKRIVSIMQRLLPSHVGQRMRFHFGSIEENRLTLTGLGIPVDALPIDREGKFDGTKHLGWLERQRIKEASFEASVGMPVPAHNPTSTITMRDTKNADDDHLPLTTSAAKLQSNIQPVGIPDSAAHSVVSVDEKCDDNDTDVGAQENGTDAILQPSDEDIVMGRGKGAQYHPGNVHLRELMCAKYDEYNQAKRWGKRSISDSIVSAMLEDKRRFLKRDESKGCWVPISRDEAREKVSHGMRKKRELDLKNKKRKQSGESGRKCKKS